MNASGSVLRTPPDRAIPLIFLITTAYVVWLNLFPWTPGQEELVSSLCLSLPNCLFAYYLFRMIRGYPMDLKLRQSWILLASAILFTMVADVLYIVTGRPAVGPSDIFFFGFYLLFVLGILRLPFRAVSHRENSLLLLDLAIVLLAALLLFWYFLIGTIEEWIANRNYAALYNLVYPLLDLLILACAVTMIQREVEGVHPKTLLLIAASYGLLSAIADVMIINSYLYWAPDDVKFANSAFMIVRFLGLLALKYQFQYLMAPGTGVVSSRLKQVLGTILPYVSCIVVIVLIVIAGATGQVIGLAIRGALLGMALLTGLVLYRQYIMLLLNAQLYRKAENARIVAENATTAKAEFLARMSHEIRSPMHGVVGMTELLLNGPLEKSQREIGETIRGCGNALLSVINEVLDFSKIESDRLELEIQPFDVRLCLKEAFDPVQFDAARKGLHLVMQVDENVPPFLMGDALRLRQIVVNLLSNAVKFTDRGQVHLNARVVEAGEECEVQVSVRDSGRGIPKDQQSKLFQSFSQVDAGRKHPEGTGLGLAISRKLCEMMGGRMWVESRDGAGSTFHFTFRGQRVSSADAPASSADSIAIDRALAQKLPLRFLVVEDNPVHQKVSILMLGQMGYVPDMARNGNEALETVRSGTYDMILMDTQMPGMDGLECARRIRQLSLPRPPVILGVTASAVGKGRDLYLQAGMNDVLNKPLLIQTLQEAILRWTQTPPFREVPRKPTSIDPSLNPLLSMIPESDRAKTLKELIAAYLSDSPGRLAAIRKGAADGNWEAVRFEAHSLKGASSVLGMRALADACAALERADGNHEPGRVLAMIAAIEQEYRQVVHDLALLQPE